MPIHYDETHQLFHLITEHTSYAFQVTPWGLLAHTYWGKKVRSDYLHRNLVLRSRSTVSPRPDPAEPAYSPDTMPQEFPAYRAGDFRPPAFEVHLDNGSSVSFLIFYSKAVQAEVVALILGCYTTCLKHGRATAIRRREVCDWQAGGIIQSNKRNRAIWGFLSIAEPL